MREKLVLYSMLLILTILGIVLCIASMARCDRLSKNEAIKREVADVNYDTVWTTEQLCLDDAQDLCVRVIRGLRNDTIVTWEDNELYNSYDVVFDSTENLIDRIGVDGLITNDDVGGRQLVRIKYKPDTINSLFGVSVKQVSVVCSVFASATIAHCLYLMRRRVG